VRRTGAVGCCGYQDSAIVVCVVLDMLDGIDVLVMSLIVRQVLRMRASHALRAERAARERAASGNTISNPWNPPFQICSSASPPAAQMRLASNT
jgi:hypothetical protein